MGGRLASHFVFMYLCKGKYFFPGEIIAWCM